MEDVRLAIVRISTLHSIIRGRKDLRHAFGYFPDRQVYVGLYACSALFLWIVFHFRVVMWCESAMVAQMAGAAFSSSV